MEKIDTRISPLYPLHREHHAHFTTLGAWELPLHYGSPEREYEAVHDQVGLSDLSPQVKLSLRGEEGDGVVKGLFGKAPEKVGDVTWTENLPPDMTGLIAYVGMAQLTRDELYLLAPPNAEQSLIPALETTAGQRQSLLTLTDLTAAYSGLLLAGPRSRDVLSKLCALPLDEGAFPDYHGAQTGLAKTRAILIRRDRGPLPAFELYSDYSYAGYLWRAVMDAGQEWGITPFGWQTHTNLGEKM